MKQTLTTAVVFIFLLLLISLLQEAGIVISAILISTIYVLYTQRDTLTNREPLEPLRRLNRDLALANLRSSVSKNKPTIVSKSTPPPKYYEESDNLYISATEKAEYLRSTEWAILREQVFHLANHKCQVCGSSNSLELHHLHYRTLTEEDPSDMACLCGGANGCHNKLHEAAALLHPHYTHGRQFDYPLSILSS